MNEWKEWKCLESWQPGNAEEVGSFMDRLTKRVKEEGYKQCRVDLDKVDNVLRFFVEETK